MEPSSRVTIRDVAARAGVSVATVSKVINNRYGVASGTTARVQAVIDELGYEASLVAQSLRNHRTNVIGILVADLEPFSTELLKGVADAIRGSGFELVIYSAGGHASERVGWERRYLSRLSGTLIDGAVLVTPTVVDVNYGTPIVAIDPHTGQSGLPTVDSDNLRGAQLATSHLLGLGHRRIAMLTGRPDLESAQLRERGYREALQAAGVPVDESLVRVGAYDPEISLRSGAAAADRPQPAHRDLRGQRRIRHRHHRGRHRTRPAGTRRPVGCGLRQHPRVGAVRPAADHDRPADPQDGRAVDRAPPPAHPGGTDRGHPHHTRHGPGRAAVNPGRACPFAITDETVTIEDSVATEIWRDPAATPAERVRDLLSRMSLREKVGQLYGIWVGVDSVRGDVVPHHHEAAPVPDWDALVGAGIGQLTRPFGTAPVAPGDGAQAVARTQHQIMAAGRFGIPAMVHEECLTGLLAWQATVFPSPLCWGASFDPGLVERMAAQIGTVMRAARRAPGPRAGPRCYP